MLLYIYIQYIFALYCLNAYHYNGVPRVQRGSDESIHLLVGQQLVIYVISYMHTYIKKINYIVKVAKKPLETIGGKLEAPRAYPNAPNLLFTNYSKKKSVVSEMPFLGKIVGPCRPFVAPYCGPSVKRPGQRTCMGMYCPRANVYESQQSAQWLPRCSGQFWRKERKKYQKKEIFETPLHVSAYIMAWAPV